MEQINLLKAERIKVENLLNNLYPQQTYRFKSSDHTRLTFQIGQYELDFLYPKERYEPEGVAVFKGVMIGSLKKILKSTLLIWSSLFLITTAIHSKSPTGLTHYLARWKRVYA